MSITPISKEGVPLAITSRPCERGEIIMEQGASAKGIILANSGYFFSYHSGADEIKRRFIVHKGPSLFGLPINDFQETCPSTVKALSKGHITTIPPQAIRSLLSDSTNRQKLKITEDNDRENISWQIAILRHSPEMASYKRLRDLFDFLTVHGKQPTPVITQENLADLLGAERAPISRTINRFKRERILIGGNAFNNLPYEISDYGKVNIDSLKNDIEFWKTYAPTSEKLLQLLEMRQARTPEARFSQGLWLLTDGGSTATPSIRQTDLGRLTAMARATINGLLGHWEIEGLLTRKRTRGGPYSLTKLGITTIKTEISHLDNPKLIV